MGFEFDGHRMDTYGAIIQNVASQFADFVIDVIVKTRATAIAAYGRGHWTMNSGAFAAASVGLPLYVLERGILTNTYIIDREVPFTGTGSRYRSAWSAFQRVQDWEDVPIHQEMTESRWQLYLDRSRVRPDETVHAEGRSNLLVGQCSFDYNCLGAPFASPKQFVDFILDNMGGAIEKQTLLYRPHPLSPEEYPAGLIETAHGRIPIDTMAPWDRLRTDCVVHTWNSTLGLEAALVFRRPLRIVDPNCHYRWILESTDAERRKFIAFLNQISLLR
jgi:hypothetical protein